MPDYGLRPPPYFSGQLPVGILGAAPYGWEQQPNRTTANTPFSEYFPSEQFVYERLDWQKFKQQIYSEGGPGGPATMSKVAGIYSNPPFMGAGQMTGPNGPPSWMKDQIGGVKRIVRGYLRRSEVIPGKPESFVRLYFMYNPDQVQRTYQSLAESQEIDPNNAIGAEADGNVASIPTVTTINFTLYFDRQIEIASIEDHPGVMVDLQTFDILSGQMILGDVASGETPVLPPGMALPANTDTGSTGNHAGQIQPKATGMPITAVFSPALAVDGILSGVSATFTKFSQTMVPMSMGINLTLMVAYIGKNNNQYTQADVGAGTMPGDPKQYNPKADGFVPPATQAARDSQTATGAAAAVAWAEANLMDSQGVYYDNVSHRGDGPPCNVITPAMTDCSSFVWRSFHAIGWSGTDQGDPLHLGGACDSYIPGSLDFITKIKANSTGNDRRWFILMELPYGDDNQDNIADLFSQLRKGDVLVRKKGYAGHAQGHVSFFYGFTGEVTGDAFRNKNLVQLIESTGSKVKASGPVPEHKQGGSVTSTSMEYIWRNYNLIARPEPWGPTTVALRHTF